MSYGSSHGGGRPYVVVYAEEVTRVVLSLYCNQPLVVVAVGRPDALLALVHHEVHVGTTSRVGMQCLRIFVCPREDACVVGRVRIDAINRLRQHGIAVGTGRRILLYPR